MTTNTNDTSLRVGVDIGGTFTDIVTIQDGEIKVNKTPSTPEAPEQAVLNGLKEAHKNNSWQFNDIAVLNARRRQYRYYDMQFSAGSYALSADSQIRRFSFS